MNDIMINELRKYTLQIMKKYHIVGASSIMVDKNDVVFQDNYGYFNSDKTAEVTKNIRFSIGSVTKILTSLAILKLEEENKLSIEDDIKKYILNLEYKSRFENTVITIKDLLMHRSGIPCDNLELEYTSYSGNYKELLNWLKDQYLIAKPKEMFAYSNIGYTLLGIIIENITKKKYHDYVKSVIFDPLEMDGDFIYTDEQSLSNIGSFSESFDEKGNPKRDNLGYVLPAGSNTFVSSSSMGRLMQMLLNYGTYKGKKVFEKETITKMFTLPEYNKIDENELCVGLGLFFNQYNYSKEIGKVVGHGGDTICYHAEVVLLLNREIGICVLTNSKNGGVVRRLLTMKIIELYAKYNEINLYKTPVKHEISTTEIDQTYVGTYANSNGIYEIYKNQKGSFLNLRGLKYKLISNEDGFFDCVPIGLTKILPIKNILGKIRIKFIDYCSYKVILIEQTRSNNCIRMPFASKVVLDETFNNDNIIGKYKIVSNYEVVKNSYKKISIIRKKGLYLIKVNTEEGTQVLTLSFVNNNQLKVVGYGRDTGNIITLNENIFDLCGLHFTKK